MAPSRTQPQEPERTCCGVYTHEIQEKRKARRNKPQPWIVLKSTVFLTIAITAYGWYVYVGRLCVPMIRRDAGALGSRGLGIGFLVAFNILGLITLWAYEKVVLTPPGYAKDHVQKTPSPVIRSALPTWWESESEAELAVSRYAASQPPPASPPPPASASSHTHAGSHHSRSGSDAGPKTPEKAARGSTSSRRTASHNGHTARPSSEGHTVGTTGTLTPVPPARVKVAVDQNHPRRSEQSAPGPAGPYEESRRPMRHTRCPSKTPILREEYRYCHKDGRLKPFRAHHCRACGTCILKYDHHCPWVGQCIGARNHRFFFIFCFWAMVSWTWTFATLVGLIARASVTKPNYEIDGQQVAIAALAGFFSFFTTALVITHFMSISSNMTTVEQMGVRRTREREERVLARLYSWWQYKPKREAVRLWDAEWGRVGKEGYIWWLGGARQNWEATMGDKAWMWFLPIGQSPDDGLSYMPNPRFDNEGRWRPRREWPLEVQ